MASRLCGYKAKKFAIPVEEAHKSLGSRLADLHLILPNEVPQLSC